jgi:hypothetical protein
MRLRFCGTLGLGLLTAVSSVALGMTATPASSVLIWTK